MSESPKPLLRWMNWGLPLPFLVLNIGLLLFVLRSLQPIVAIVGTAALLAFLLEYPVFWLEKRRFPRTLAVGTVFLLALSAATIFGITIAPFLWDQLQELSSHLPNWLDSGTKQLQVLQVWADSRHLPLDLSDVVTNLQERVSQEVRLLPTQTVNFAIATLDGAIEFLVTGVLTFYFLLHGERLWEGIFLWLPPQVGARAQSALQENFEKYFIGQATIATIMSVALSIVFWLLKVPFSALFASAIGLMVLIPFGDIVGIVAISALVALNSVWLGLEVLLFAAAIDQAIDQAIAPRILGQFTGLNPIWVIIALLLGAKAGGILGLFVAVPIAATIKTLAEDWRDRQKFAVNSGKDASIFHPEISAETLTKVE